MAKIASTIATGAAIAARRAEQRSDARGRVSDEGVAELLEDHGQRIEHVDVQQRRTELTPEPS